MQGSHLLGVLALAGVQAQLLPGVVESYPQQGRSPLWQFLPTEPALSLLHPVPQQESKVLLSSIFEHPARHVLIAFF